MELMAKQRFIQTEVGVFPEDWRVTEFGELTERIVGGGTPSRAEPLFWNGNIPWVTVKDFATFDPHTTQEYITSAGVYNSATNVIPKGTLIFCTRIALGKAVIYEVDACINQDLKAAFFKQNVDVNYLYYWFQQNAKRIHELGSGSTVMGISLSDLKRILVPIPPTKEEQTAIATALSDADALIAALEKLIETKRLIKQGAMQELLRSKKGWEVKTLGDIADVVGGGTPSTFIDSFWNGDINWFTPTEVGSTKYVYESLRKITKAGLNNSGARILSPGTVLLTSRAGIGDVSILKREACTNQGFQSLVPKTGCNGEYLYYLAQTLKPALMQNASGSTFLEVSPRKVKDIQVIMPPIAEQTSIANILGDMDVEINRLERKLSKHKELKQGMMQVLLTGKVRLVAAHDTKRTIELKPQRIKQKTGHNVQFNEAVLISVLTERYGSVKYPLGRFRYTKFLYLFHRHVEGAANGFLKKAAGPYNPSNRYGGPEGIAVKNKYVQPEGKGFVAYDNIGEAKRYFSTWYHDDALVWLDRFRFYKNDQLELLTTVDMAVDDLRKEGKDVSVTSVRAVIASNKEWKPKLEKEFFNDAAIAGAIQESTQLFPS